MNCFLDHHNRIRDSFQITIFKLAFISVLYNRLLKTECETNYQFTSTIMQKMKKSHLLKRVFADLKIHTK